MKKQSSSFKKLHMTLMERYVYGWFVGLTTSLLAAIHGFYPYWGSPVPGLIRLFFGALIGNLIFWLRFKDGKRNFLNIKWRWFSVGLISAISNFLVWVAISGNSIFGGMEEGYTRFQLTVAFGSIAILIGLLGRRLAKKLGK